MKKGDIVITKYGKGEIIGEEVFRLAERWIVKLYKDHTFFKDIACFFKDDSEYEIKKAP